MMNFSSMFARTRTIRPEFVRSLQTTPRRQAIPPALYLFAKPLARLTAAFFGKSVRVWWKRLPANRKLEVKNKLLEHKKKIGFAGTSFFGGLVYAYESHVQECSVTGRRRFVALYPDQVKKISKQEFEASLDEYKSDILHNKHPSYERVVRVSNRLLHANRDIRQIYDKTWTVTVVDLPIQNAYVLPSGNIFVFRGMLDFCRNDDALAVILAHEMAHAIIGHGAEKLTRASFISWIMLVPMALLWAVIPSDGIALVTDWFIGKVNTIFLELPFDRAMESEADEVGLQMMAKACYDVREAPVVWKIMELIDEDEISTDKDLEFLSTHPAHCTRYESLLEQLSSAIKIRCDFGCSRLDPKCDPFKDVNDFKTFLNNQKAMTVVR